MLDLTLNLEEAAGTGNSLALRDYYPQVNSDSLFAAFGCCLWVDTGFLPMILSAELGMHCHPSVPEIGAVVTAKFGLHAFGLVAVRTAARRTASVVD